jgi:hypothetical protein
VAGKPVSGGTVTVKQGNKVICVIQVVNGKGTCKVPATRFGVGTSAVVGEYSGPGYPKSKSQPVSVNVLSTPIAATRSTPAG